MKVYLYAYDKVNLGDDLFIETIANRYPDVQFYLESDISNRAVFSDVKNLYILDKESVQIKLLEKILPSFAARYRENKKKRCDAVVYIGGSIFMEYPTWKNIVTWWKYQGKHYPFYVLGANFGPYHTEEYRKEMGQAFSELKDVCFRDQYSKDLFPDVATVRQAADILYGYPMPVASNVKKQIFFSVISLKKSDGKEDRFTQESYIRQMADIAGGYVEDGYEVVLASFCKEEGDLETAKLIQSKMKSQDQVRICSYEGMNRHKFLVEMASSEYILASRFHGVILGAVAKRPVFPIYYSDKTKHILKDINFQGSYGDLRVPETLTYENSKRNLDNHTVIDTKDLIEDAKRQFEKLDEVLRK